MRTLWVVRRVLAGATIVMLSAACGGDDDDSAVQARIEDLEQRLGETEAELEASRAEVEELRAAEASSTTTPETSEPAPTTDESTDTVETTEPSTTAEASTTTAEPTTTTAATTAPPTTIATAAGTRQNPVPLGQRAEVGEGWSVTVNGVDFDAFPAIQAANEFNEPPPADHVYVMVHVTVGYDGPEQKSSDGVIFSAVGAGNVEINAFETFVSPPEPYNSSIDVFQGGTTSGNVVFTVPVGDVETLQVYAEAFLSFDEDETFFALR